MEQTITYSDKVLGWTSFHSFSPDGIAQLDNRLVTIKDGQLWLHNDNDNTGRNNFYGAPVTSKITTVINDMNSEDKIFKTLVLESNNAWDAEIATNLTNSTIDKEEFNQRESRFFAHTRQNENVEDLHGNAVQGIGNIISATGITITYSRPPQLVNVNDVLYQINGSAQEIIGTITAIAGPVITVDAITTTPVVGRFSFAKKNARVEGSELRGFYAEVTLSNDGTDRAELYAIEMNAVKSFV